jgi:hypothetical protein
MYNYPDSDYIVHEKTEKLDVEIAEGGRLKEKLERKTGKCSCGMHASESFDVRSFFLE